MFTFEIKVLTRRHKGRKGYKEKQAIGNKQKRQIATSCLAFRLLLSNRKSKNVNRKSNGFS
jgi:hypothetical protein